MTVRVHQHLSDEDRQTLHGACLIAAEVCITMGKHYRKEGDTDRADGCRERCAKYTALAEKIIGVELS